MCIYLSLYIYIYICISGEPKEHPQLGVYVAGLQEIPALTSTKILQLIDQVYICIHIYIYIYIYIYICLCIYISMYVFI